MIHIQQTLRRSQFHLDIDLEIPSSGITAIFGPSGCGKSTLIRAIIGLEVAPGGIVKLPSICWQNEQQNIPTHQRNIGVVFQHPFLYQHLTVERNILFGAENKDLPDLELILEQLELTPLLQRKVSGLSGGELQRITIARALIRQPELLILDEAVSALDYKKRKAALDLIQQLSNKYSIPVLYVSHDLEEVARIADHLVLMDHGKITYQGDFIQALQSIDQNISQRSDSFCILTCQLDHINENFQFASLTLGAEKLMCPISSQDLSKNVRIQIHARDVSICLDKAERTSISNVLAAKIEEIEPRGEESHQLVKLKIHNQFILARLSVWSIHQLNLKTGMKVYAQIKAVALAD